MPQIWGKTEPSAQSRGQKDNSGYSCQKVRKRRYQSFLVQSSLTRFPYFVRIISSMVIWTNPFLPLIHPSLLKSYVFWHLVFDITLVIGSFLIEPSFLRQKFFFFRDFNYHWKCTEQKKSYQTILVRLFKFFVHNRFIPNKTELDI